MNIVFTYLTAFSRNGGIEKFNKTFVYLLSRMVRNGHFKLLSVYDHQADAHYLNSAHFKGFKGKRLGFMLRIWKSIFSADVLIIGHINLAVVAIVAKLLNPRIKLIVVAHGIEVWQPLGYKRKALQWADRILAVSQFTAHKLVTVNKIDSQKIHIFPNTIEPFFASPTLFQKSASLLQRYGIDNQQKVVLTVCRLSAVEAYKGYDRIIEGLPLIIKQFPNAVYLIVGKYDAPEKLRLDGLVRSLNLEKKVKFTGFVPDSELTAHFLLGDVFAMPSKNEGFGIVFIEAMVCGLPVVAGNSDGSVDALANGELGSLVNPDSASEIANAIIKALHQNWNFDTKTELQKKGNRKVWKYLIYKPFA